MPAKKGRRTSSETTADAASSNLVGVPAGFGDSPQLPLVANQDVPNGMLGQDRNPPEPEDLFRTVSVDGHTLHLYLTYPQKWHVVWNVELTALRNTYAKVHGISRPVATHKRRPVPDAVKESLLASGLAKPSKWTSLPISALMEEFVFVTREEFAKELGAQLRRFHNMGELPRDAGCEEVFAGHANKWQAAQAASKKPPIALLTRKSSAGQRPRDITHNVPIADTSEAIQHAIPDGSDPDSMHVRRKLRKQAEHEHPQESREPWVCRLCNMINPCDAIDCAACEEERLGDCSSDALSKWSQPAVSLPPTYREGLIVGCKKKERIFNSEEADDQTCYACIIRGTRCSGRELPTLRDGVLADQGFGRVCMACSEIGLTHRQCVIPPTSFLAVRADRLPHCKDNMATTCHLCKRLGPVPGSRQCIGCGIMVCDKESCQKGAYVQAEAPFFVCCHCLNVSFLCGCAEGKGVLLQLATTVQLPIPSRHFWKFAHVDVAAHPVPCRSHVPGGWLLESATPRKWTSHELTLVSDHFIHMRSILQRNPQLDKNNVLQQAISMLGYSAPVLARLFTDIEDLLLHDACGSRHDSELLGRLGWITPAPEQPNRNPAAKRRRRLRALTKQEVHPLLDGASEDGAPALAQADAIQLQELTREEETSDDKDSAELFPPLADAAAEASTRAQLRKKRLRRRIDSESDGEEHGEPRLRGRPRKDALRSTTPLRIMVDDDQPKRIMVDDDSVA